MSKIVSAIIERAPELNDRYARPAVATLLRLRRERRRVDGGHHQQRRVRAQAGGAQLHILGRLLGRRRRGERRVQNALEQSAVGARGDGAEVQNVIIYTCVLRKRVRTWNP